MTTDPQAVCWMSATEVAAAIGNAQLSSQAVTEIMLERIGQLEPRLHAFATVMADAARAQAVALDAEVRAGRRRGPLHGVPIAVKDLCDTAGVRTMGGMPLHHARVPSRDATVVRRLRDAGAVLLGKLQMTEGAFSAHHPDVDIPVNPWDNGLWSGVSSSGSGVATAAGLAYASLGSDTLGSIRFPSAMNGLTGLKPTFGRVSVAGVLPLSPSMDHVGPMARSVADVAAMLTVIAGPDAADPTSIAQAPPDWLGALGMGVVGMRVGIDERQMREHADADSLNTTLAAADVLAAAGARIVPIAFPASAAVAADALTLVKAELAVVHRDTWPSQRAAYGPVLDGLIASGHKTSARELAEIRARRESFAQRVAACFDSVDVILMPALNVAAASIADLARQTTNIDERLARLFFTAPINMSRNPSLTLPGGFTAGSAPIAFQMISACRDEAQLLAAGHAFQLATTWHRRHPVLA